MLVWLGARVQPADSGRDAREATVLLRATWRPAASSVAFRTGTAAALIAISVCCQRVAACMAAGHSVMVTVVHFISGGAACCRRYSAAVTSSAQLN